MAITAEQFALLSSDQRFALQAAARRSVKLRSTLARTDPSIFNEFVLRDERSGRPIRQAPMHHRWQELINSYRNLVIWSHVDAGKALPLDTPIPSPDGWTTMGALRVGARVFGSDGAPYRVTFATPVQHERRLFEVEFSDGVVERADADHNWAAWTVDDRAAGRAPRVVTTLEMAARLRRGRGWMWTVPVAAPARYPEADLPVDPYLLGARLGDGDAANKHIPALYLTASIAQRRALLAGLLGTDGSTDGRGRGRVELTLCDQRLAEDATELVRSLGYKARISESAAKRRWRLSFTARKQAVLDLCPRTSTATTRRTVVAIREVPSVPVRCIQVDSPDHTFLMGRSYTVTHNTNQVAIGRALWEIGRNPNIRICIASKTTDMAAKIVRAVGQYISHSDALRRVFPGLRPNQDPALTWTSRSLTVDRPTTSKDPTVAATGIQGNIHGSRIDLLLIDDLIDLENTTSASERNTTWAWLRGTAMGRLSDNARIIVTGNAWHPEDAMHRLVREAGFFEARFPVVDLQGTLTWPEHWTHARIEERRKMVGPLEFSRQMLCQARDDETARFKREYIDRCLARGLGVPLVLTAAELFQDLADRGELAGLTSGDVDAWDAARRLGSAIEPAALGGVRIFTGVDLAVSRREGADLTAFFTIAILPNGDRRVLEAVSGRWSAPEIIARVKDTWARFGSTIIIENNAAQDYILQMVRKDSAVPVVAFRTGAQKADPTLGVEGLANEFANKKWIIPCGTDGTRTREIDAWVQELYHYEPPPTHTGDRLMASWFAREGVRPYETMMAVTGGNVRVTVIEP